MLWEAATGRRFWQGHDEMEVFRRLTAGDLPLAASGLHGVKAEMLRIAVRALAVDPAERYPTAETMRVELETLLDGLGAKAEPDALVGYLEAHFSAERDKLDASIAEAVDRFRVRPSGDGPRLSEDDSVSCVPTERNVAVAARRSVSLTEGSLPTSVAPHGRAHLSERAERAGGWVQKGRRYVRRGFGVAGGAISAAVIIAYAAHSPQRALAPSAALPGVPKGAMIADVAAGNMNRTEVEATARDSQQPTHPAVRLAPGEILAVFAARPSAARLFLDGVPLSSNPISIPRQPDQKRHLLRAEAPGYATLVSTIELNRDIVKELELTPETLQAVAPPGGASTDARPESSKAGPLKQTVVREDPWGI
jgi:serine/threonine-protein kinase